MQAAFQGIRRDLRNPANWDDLNDPPEIIVILEMRNDRIRLHIYYVPDYHSYRFPLIRLFSRERDSVVCIDDIDSAPRGGRPDIIIGVVPAKDAVMTCSVSVTVKSWCTLALNQWTLQVAPGDTLIPIFHGCAFIPLGPTTDVKIKVISEKTQYQPRIVSAYCSDVVRRDMASRFGIGPLHPELLPDLRYEGPLDFGVLMTEAFWHPTRVAKNLSLLDIE